MNIYESITAIIGDVSAVGKEKNNDKQGFKYRGIDDVMNAMQPLLARHKVFAVPEVLEQKREERQTGKGGNLIYSICKIKFTFYAEDGTNISAVTIGEGMDSGDKATNKAMSIAFKYALFQVFCIPTEEMQDPDAETHETQPQEFACCICNKEITGYTTRNGEQKTAAQAAAISKQMYGRVLCSDCMRRQAEQ